MTTRSETVILYKNYFSSESHRHICLTEQVEAIADSASIYLVLTNLQSSKTPILTPMVYLLTPLF